MKRTVSILTLRSTLAVLYLAMVHCRVPWTLGDLRKYVENIDTGTFFHAPFPILMLFGFCRNPSQTRFLSMTSSCIS